jgi:hypothetical protein
MTSSLEKFNLVYFEITTRECKSMRYNQKLVLLLLWFCTMQDKLAFFHREKKIHERFKTIPIAMNLSYVSSYVIGIWMKRWHTNVGILDACDYSCLVPTHLVMFLKHFGRGLKRHVMETFSSFHGVFQLVSHLIPLDLDFASHMLI